MLRELLSCDTHWVFSWENVFGCRKNHGYGKKNRSEGTSLAMFGVGNRNAANVSDVPTEFAAELK